MRFHFSTLIIFAVVIAAGCDEQANGLGDEDSGLGTVNDDGAANHGGGNSGSTDAFSVAFSDALTMPPVLMAECGATKLCPAAKKCLAGKCQEDQCAANAKFTCAADKACQASCVKVENKCAGVVCPAMKTCVDGGCVAGCFKEPCNDVQCKDGEFCDANSGKCTKLSACDGLCPAGQACNLTCIPKVNACDNVACKSDEFCVAGACVKNPCAAVSCPAGNVCVNGSCVDTCACTMSCNQQSKCVQGVCECAPKCEPGQCGSDGCGGKCPCASGTKCYQDSCCVPNCPANGSKACMSDGCGGSCACPAGAGSCYQGKCCQKSCPADGSKACMPDGCGGTCGCPSGGGSCYQGKCCQKSCPADGSKACMPDGCGGTCACPSGKGNCYQGMCCAPVCPAGTCGTNGCGGTCKCPTGSTCSNGKCSAKVCSPACGCGQVCYDGQCIALACDADEFKCGCGCCPLGNSCVAGQCLPPGTVP